MKDPSIQHVLISLDNSSDQSSVITMFKDLVELVLDTENGVSFTEFSKDDLDQFFDSLPKSTFEDILEHYWLKYPQLRHTVKFNCPVCGHAEDINFTGLSDFFT
jgi:hypothetical protein